MMISVLTVGQGHRARKIRIHQGIRIDQSWSCLPRRRYRSLHSGWRRNIAEWL